MTTYIVFTAEVKSPYIAKLKEALIMAANSGNDVYLLISSQGGDVPEGLNIAALMRLLPIKITTHNINFTDSVANVIFAAGTTRYANPSASFMFHGFSSHFQAGLELGELQLEEHLKSLQRMRQSIAFGFAKYAGLPDTEVGSLTGNASVVLSASDALKKSIIHEIRDATIPAGAQIISIGNV